ncbi:hypothetical protein ACLK11_05035 [Escherichia coli]
MNIWHVDEKSMFCFDNPLVFCENIRGRKKTVFLYAHNHACKYDVYRASEILRMAWTDAIRDVDSCHKATVLTVDPRIARRESSRFRSIVTGSDSEQ